MKQNRQEEKMFDIQEELKKLPGKPGVYLMYDSWDHIIYIGKAVSLKNRVRQYFQTGRNKGAKIEQMVSRIERFEYIVTDSEMEALILECNLIKEHHPRYNTMLMDDKTYPFIRVTVEEEFPRIFLARKIEKNRSKYFGPYPSAGAVKDTIELIRKLYHIRSCNRKLPRDIGKERPCLNYHIHQCEAPCQGYVSSEEYKRSVDKVLRFLGGEYEEVCRDLRVSMEEASEKLEFEKALEYRELLASVEQISQKQKMAYTAGEDRDLLAIAKEEEEAVVQVFFIRGGRLIGRDHFYMRTQGEETEEILTSFLKQFYGGTPYVPTEIMLPVKLSEAELLEKWLSGIKGQRVHLKVPQKGSKERLMELAAQNAGMVLRADKDRLKREKEKTTGAVKELEDLLGLSGIDRMEAFDISNISGFSSVGSMVVYEQGKPKKNDYRKFKIKSVQGPDDYRSMEEVLTRRFSRGMREKEEDSEKRGFVHFPDLILMDGGKGQVHVAEQVLGKLGLSIPVCGMVKDDRHRTRGLYYREQEIAIAANSQAFHLITRIQDEAHRFAITFHRSLRGKEQIHSVLDDIPQIGPARRKDLMRHYASLEEIRKAEIEELSRLPTMNEGAARSVYDFFHPREGKDCVSDGEML